MAPPRRLERALRTLKRTKRAARDGVRLGPERGETRPGPASREAKTRAIMTDPGPWRWPGQGGGEGAEGRGKMAGNNEIATPGPVVAPRPETALAPAKTGRLAAKRPGQRGRAGGGRPRPAPVAEGEGALGEGPSPRIRPGGPGGRMNIEGPRLRRERKRPFNCPGDGGQGRRPGQTGGGGEIRAAPGEIRPWFWCQRAQKRRPILGRGV